jgi:hypothetical protein
MQQFLAKRDDRNRTAGRDDSAGRSIDFGDCDGQRARHRFDGDLEVHVDDDGQHHGFDGKSNDHNGDRRMRSYQHRLSEIRLGERRDAERADLYGAAIGELPATGTGDYADSKLDGREEQERLRHRKPGFGHPRRDYAVDSGRARGAKSRGDNEIHGVVLE